VPEEVKDLTTAEANAIKLPYSYLKCDHCYLQDRCPHFKAEQSCVFSLFEDFSKKENMMDMLKNIIAIQYGRVLRGKLVEEADGGVPDKVVSVEIKMLLDLLKSIKELSSEQESISIQAKGGPGIISQLFGGAKK